MIFVPCRFTSLQSVNSVRMNLRFSSSCSKPFPIAASRVTFMRFCVSVPVLSEQMTSALPKVSTAGSLRIIVFFLAIRCIPIASTIVTIAGSPSGIAATARLTEVINIGNGGCLRKSPIPKIIPQIINAPMPSSLPVSPSFFCKGVSRSSCSAKRAAICPISVAMPVAVTATVPLPART